jgi:hypothetical protein
LGFAGSGVGVVTVAKPATVYAKIAAVQGELAKVGIAKTRRNTQGSGYNFRGIDDVYAALAPLLAQHGLVIVPRVISREVIERSSKSGNALFYVTVHAEFDFVSADDGSSHTAATYGEAMDSADKATNKAMSAAYKYAAFMTFAIPTEGDNDADGHTPEVATKNACITDAQRTELINMLEQMNVPVGPFLQVGNISDLAELPAGEFEVAKRWINQQAVKQSRDAAPGKDAPDAIDY